MSYFLARSLVSPFMVPRTTAALHVALRNQNYRHGRQTMMTVALQGLERYL